MKQTETELECFEGLFRLGVLSQEGIERMKELRRKKNEE